MDNTIVKWGVISALASIIITLFHYYVANVGIWTMMFVGFAMMVAFMVLSANEEKRKNGGYLSYGEAFKTSFLSSVLAVVISQVFIFILSKVDAGLPDRAMDMARQTTEEMLKGFNMDQDQIDLAVEQAGKKNPFEPMTILIGLISAVVFSAIFAAVTSFFTKKERNVFGNAIDNMDLKL